MAQATAKLVNGGEATWVDPSGTEIVADETHASAARANMFAPFKPRVDLLVAGHAYAPPGRDTDRVVVRIRVGDYTKILSVMGDRVWVKNGGRWATSAPRPFSQMLLVPERAVRSAENPAGLDPATLPVEGRLALPNIEPVGGPYTAVVGPVRSDAPSRAGLLGAHALSWVKTFEMGGAPGAAPDGVNFAYFNIAPLDQQVTEVAPGVALVLENVHPTQPMFTSRLPFLRPVVTAVDPVTGRRMELGMRCDTLWIDADREIATLIFRGVGEVSRPDLAVPINVELDRRAPQVAVSPMLGTTQQGAPASGHAAALPFAPSFGGRMEDPQRVVGIAPEGFPPWLSAPGAQPRSTQAVASTDGPTESYPPPPEPPTRTITAEIELGLEANALPFAHDLDEPTTGQWQSSPHRDVRDEPSTRDTAPPPGPSQALPYLDTPPAQDLLGSLYGPDSTGNPDTVPRPAGNEKRLTPHGTAGPPPQIDPTPPPVLPAKKERPKRVDAPGRTQPIEIRLHGFSSAPLRPAQPVSSEDPSTETELTPESEAPETTVGVEPPPKRDTLSLDECASLRAELAFPGADRGTVFDKYNVDESTFARLEREHLKAIDEANRSGNGSMLDQYDDAYVSALDALRAPVDMAAYARIAVARESGQLAHVLDELGVPRTELMRIDRVWRRKLAKDKSLAEQVEDEMERLRGGT